MAGTHFASTHLTRFLAALLVALLAACAPAPEIPVIEGANRAVIRVDRMTPLGMKLDREYGDTPVAWCEGQPATRCSLKLVKETTDTTEIAALAAFANERRDGFTAPGLTTPPSGTLSVRFHDGEARVDAFEVGGSGATYFIARTVGFERLYRRLPLEDLALLAGLLGHAPADLFTR